MKSRTETRSGRLVSADGHFVATLLYDVIIDELPTGDLNVRGKTDFKLDGDSRPVANKRNGEIAITDPAKGEIIVFLEDD